jgi:hypothetical protein
MGLIANVALTNTFDTWRTRTNQTATRINQFAINESSLYANTITANVAFMSKSAAVFGTTIRYGGITLANTVTGTGSLVLAASPTFTGHPTIEGVTPTGATGTGKLVFSTSPVISGPLRYGGITLANTVTGTGSLVLAASPTFTGTVTGVSATMVGLGNVTNESKATMFASPTFTGTVTGVSATMVGLGNVTNESKATMFTSPTFTGTMTDQTITLSQTLTDGVTISWNTDLGRIATVTLGGNRTMAAPTNLKAGTYILYVIQDATGSRTLTWNSVFKWTAAVAPVLTTTAARRDIMTFVSDGTNLYGSYLPDVR